MSTPQVTGFFGLTESEVSTLISLAAAAADEKRLGAANPYDEALTSFSDPDEVHDLAVRTWKEIETG